MIKFEDLNLKNELLNSLKEMNFVNPTEVQERSIPLILEGNDVVVRSKTGTGKTGAFLIPILNRIESGDIQSSLVVVPTRELALQVFNVAKKMSAGMDIKTTVVYGGASIETQIKSLRKGSNIIIGTPGRIIDLINRKNLDFRKLRYLVLDEADIMLDMGFIEDIEYIISATPRKKQSMLFSATIPERIAHLAKKYMYKPKHLSVGQNEELTVNTISHSYAIPLGSSKIGTLLAYIKEYSPNKSIIFTETKRGADILYNFLNKQGYDVTVMHGDLTQAQREKSLLRFRNYTQFLIATNVAARGLDIPGISDIINFDAPTDPYVYVHRVGRTARMGVDGRAFTIVDKNEWDLVEMIENSANIRMSRLLLNDELLDGSELEYYNYNQRPNFERKKGHSKFDRSRRRRRNPASGS